MRPRPFTATMTLFVCALSPGCLDDTVGAANWPPPAPAGTCPTDRLLAIVGSDYQSSALSFVDRETMTRRSSAWLHSGTSVGATGAALSGDVVLATGNACAAIAVDRASGVLTSIAVGDGTAPTVGWQLNVGGDFFANPQDVIAIDDDLYAVRAQSHPSKGDGDDLLRFDASTRQTSSRVELSSLRSQASGYAFGGRSAWDGDAAWVPIASVSKTFDGMGPGRVVKITGKPLTAKGATVLAAPQGIRNCTVARWFPQRQQIAVVCSGFFKAKDQTAESALLLIGKQTSSIEMAVAATLTARPAAPARPFFGDVACAKERCWVIALGDGKSKRSDAVWEIATAKPPTATRIFTSSKPFATSALYFDHARERLWISDTGHPTGDLRIFSCPAGKPCTPLATLDSNPGGVPAVSMEPL